MLEDCGKKTLEKFHYKWAFRLRVKRISHFCNECVIKRMNICLKCQKEIPYYFVINGKKRSLTRRKFCLNCSPFGRHNTCKNPLPFSKLDSLNEEEFKTLVKNSRNRAEILRKVNISHSGGAYQVLNKRFKKWNCDISHFKNYDCSEAAKFNTIPLDEILIENSFYKSSSKLKKRLIKEKLLEEKCYECSNGPQWNGKTLILQLDHVNGNRKDNRLKNLRILCPNCHSQTETWGSKNKNKIKDV